MKRMSEVFELPVSNNEVYISPNLIERSKGKSSEILEHAAHAINHIDALADALEALLECAAENNLEGLFAYDDAEDALAAYRGDK